MPNIEKTNIASIVFCISFSDKPGTLKDLTNDLKAIDIIKNK